MNVTIRESTDRSLLVALNQDVQDLHATLHPEIFKPYDEEAMAPLFEWALNQERYHHFVAFDAETNQPLGYIQIEQRSYPENTKRHQYTVLYIHQICVTRSHQGLGIGRRLLDRACSFAAERGIQRIEVDVWSSNSQAKRFYQEYGFANFNERMCLTL